MSNNILTIAEHLNGKIEDISFELLGKGKALAAASGGKNIAVLLGHGVKDMAGQFGAADTVLYADHASLAAFNPEAYLRTLVQIAREQQPKIILVAYSSMGMDLASALAVSLDMPVVAWATDVAVSGGITVTSQLYGGKISVDSAVDGDRCVVAALSGAFPAAAGKSGGAPEVQEVSVGNLDNLKIRFKRLIEPEGGDVDITQKEVLVSVGRGIQSQDNLPVVQALADKLGAALSSSRPIVDNKWLPKTRQVGKSGLKVKPKIYIAVGISGAPEHIEGMKDAECIIAINTDPKAPIFEYAHYGVTADLFDVVPALTDKL